jgi:hypothetical protein
LAHTEPLCSSLAPDTALSRCAAVRRQLTDAGLFADGGEPGSGLPGVTSWRISPCPFLLSRDQLNFFTALGPHLLAFYQALNRLYLDSAKGIEPAWIARYLDQGKPEGLVAFARMKRFKDALPAVIRPDIIPTQDGMVITELDSVPGGIGLTAAMSQAYADADAGTPVGSPPAYRLVGGPDGMLTGFASMLAAVQGDRPGAAAIVVSEEAKDYRPEMTWVASRLQARGLPVHCAGPRDVRFTEEGLRLSSASGEVEVGVVYRFFELFDLPNIPKAELIQYTVKKRLVAITPPYKPALEEKGAFALLHHPVLRPFWTRELGEGGYLHLTTIMPRTWLLDPAAIPPAATIPGLHLGGRAVTSFEELAQAGQKERHFVIKPSGFSELAWGSRGVSVGHDLPQAEWAAALHTALTSFPKTPYVLQEFHKGRLFDVDYEDPAGRTIVRMSGRVRLSPYYFVTGGTATLAGILATVCPADKKILHGMRDAVMTPCAVLAT